jgi:transketolase
VKIVAVISPQLFRLQDAATQASIVSPADRWDSMAITNRSIRWMKEWIAHPWAKEWSLAADWDERWRTGGTVDEVLDEAHLGTKHILEGIERFVRERDRRIARLKEAAGSLA